ncbi:TatD family hydrolase [Propionimicrobium sp. PCR01-08-3]|uniref:TatD family hydrolase n=1 Tax=Propionimicrobium sp. PCR01-08-3 TaxID=3052086 RepID=UPI00255C41F4|nr:TatD family hydrolase [Propionimicrobium sp. PCR01-08-3]WIY83013.1 TatD family hydrolase [Propionimicrobium sp. PCR01-08-3]
MSESVIERLGLPELPEALPRPTTDSHTHLDSTQEFSGLRTADNIEAAASIGVHRIVQIGCDVQSSQWAVNLAANCPQVVAAVAIHPNDAARMSDADAEQAWRVIDSLASAGRHVRAVGETGLDYFRTRDASGIARQKVMFVRHIATAKQYGLTLVIHDRDAHGDIADILDAEGWPERVVMHCFSGDAEFARRCLDHGAWLSFAGNVTYKANHQMREGLAIVPLDRILAETDAPYLTPIPHRGKANAPYLMAHTVRFLAEQKGADLAEFCTQLDVNATAAFGGRWGVSIRG